MATRLGSAGIVLRAQWKVVAVACATALLHPALASGERRRRPGRGVERHSRVAASLRPAKKVRERPRAVQPARGSTTHEHVHVQRGDTLGALLAARGIGAAEARAWVAAAATVYDVRQLRPRRGLTLRFDRATHRLEALRYEIDDRSLLLLAKTRDGIRAERSTLPYFMEVRGVAGRIESGLKEDAGEAGVPERIVSDLADIYGWELDIGSGLRPGDGFRVLYENIWQVGAPLPEVGKVLGAEIATPQRAITAVFFEDADGRGGYYRPSGEPLSRDWLRYPVDFTEITSEFSGLRRHPILGFSRPHFGVDFAAPVGTPVRAVTGGTVSHAGRLGQLGQCVRLGHPGALTSTYGHLARIAAGLRVGGVVERGQVIGYVGSTGLATGPHLHFALDRDGEYVDPLALTSQSGVRLPESARRAFERVQTAVTRQLAALPRTANPLTVSLAGTGSLFGVE